MILASASAARQTLLRQAGLAFDICPADLDEGAIKRDAVARGLTARDAALDLAVRKAATVDRPGALVIGCDQILVCEGIWFDKPRDLREAARHLRRLRGNTHALETATVVMRDGVDLWRHVETPQLTMHAFSESFLQRYLEDEGPQVLGSVGAYLLEGHGARLFKHVEGESSAILGLPMPPLLGFLRGIDMIMP